MMILVFFYVGEIVARGGKDFYKILGVDRQADERTLKKAYRREAMKHHPDKGGSGVVLKEYGYYFGRECQGWTCDPSDSQ